jgi:hypothetical protein|tara:strand:+ start:321 stop:827 length:507 start_codon:yes stop_codon:yes gene_type:complete
MKKFLITLIYASLATMVVAYLFKTLNWSGFGEMAAASLWLHIGSYLGYSILVKENKDDRILYPMIVLVITVLANVLNLGAESSTMSLVVYVVLLAYVAFHLLAKDFLDKNDIPFLRKLSMGAIGLFVTAGVFKMAHFSSANMLLIIGGGTVAFMLLLVGTTKGLKRKK